MVPHDSTTDCQTAGGEAKLDELARLLSQQNPDRIQALKGILMADIVETLKQAILKSEMSRYELANISKVSEAVLSRFLSGERGITLETAGKIAKTLKLQLTPVSDRRKVR